MVGMTLLERNGPITRAERDAMPDDGRRYELIDGLLVVTPAPGFDHQYASGRLYRILDDACPPDLCVLTAPFDVVLADDTVLEPDLLVAPLAAFTRRDLPAAPLLAVEILSPTTRRYDLTLKRERYRAAGCRLYWVVDPAVPAVTAWELRGGDYLQVGQAQGAETFRTDAPYPLEIVPARLIPPG